MTAGKPQKRKVLIKVYPIKGGWRADRETYKDGILMGGLTYWFITKAEAQAKARSWKK
jgi:hypothetical protein